MGLKNPQENFENAIFGPNGIHPTPKELPYPKRPLKTIYGDTYEYVIPPEDKAKVLRELYPFGNLPSMRAILKDIHSGLEFETSQYKVIEQNGYVMPVSPFFAEDGASVVDWELQPLKNETFFESKVNDPELASAFSSGYADGFTGRDEGATKPARKSRVADERYREVEDAYIEGYGMGYQDRRRQTEQDESLVARSSVRQTRRRPRK